jgi:hypothetical protein
MPHPNIASGDWQMPAAAGVAAGAGAGVLGAQAYQRHQDNDNAEQTRNSEPVLFSERAEPAAPAVVPIASSKEEPKSNGTESTDHPIQTTTNTVPAIATVPTGGSQDNTSAPTSDAKIPESTPALLEDHAATAPAQPFAVAAADAIGSSDAASTSGDATPTNSSAQEEFPLGGNEKEGAHLTGQLFPKVIRHDTDITINRLHVPGEFK